MKLDASWYSDKEWRGFVLHDTRRDLLERHVFVTWVAGMSYYPAAADLPDFAPGREVVLRPEPSNPFDPNAIGVWNASASVQVGHLPAVIARDLPRLPGERYSPEGGAMDEHENAFPMDFYAEDTSPRPWKFRPEGYLVVILSDAGEAQRAESSLVSHGFTSRDVKLYTGKLILQNYEVYLSRRNTTDKVVGSVTDDSEGRELYLGYAREDRCAMWVRIPDENDVPKALRVLADHDYVHTRYYGSEQQTDFKIDPAR